MNASELIIQNEKLKLALDVAMETLLQISETPRNAGAKRNASATLKFIETQLASKSSY